MKMRGYSVLFVCALCVFLLCGAAAVVAQDETPEKKAAGEAKAIADTAKEKGEKALADYKELAGNATSAGGDLDTAVTDIGKLNETANSIAGGSPSKEDVKKEIGKLETSVTKAKEEVEKLKTIDVENLKDRTPQNKLTIKIKEVEDKVKEAKAAADGVKDDNSTTIDAVIAKADELRTAAGEACDMFNATVQDLEAQLQTIDGAGAAINKSKEDIKAAVREITKNGDANAGKVKDRLPEISTAKLDPSLEKINIMKTASTNAKAAAGEAKGLYNRLADKAKELKEAAEERKRKGQNSKSRLPGESSKKETEDYSAGPLCSVALPAFFFCWCVLFGV